MSTAVRDEIDVDAPLQAKTPFVRRIRLRNYKSIAFCDVALEPLTVLVGRNASGKSNFLDALAFVANAIATNLAEATVRRGGWKSILSRSAVGEEIAIELELTIPAAAPEAEAAAAAFGFALGEGPVGTPVLLREWYRSLDANAASCSEYLLTATQETSRKEMAYQWRFRHPETPCERVPLPVPDQLWISRFQEVPFRALSERLRSISCYNFQPHLMRQPQKALPGGRLSPDGRNLAGVLEYLRATDPPAAERVAAYLQAVVREAERFEVVRFGDYRTLQFTLHAEGSGRSEVFDASAMSDGTLRVLATLAAVFQPSPPTGAPAIVGIEEPETALHPAAMPVLVDALDEATLRTQVLLTTHSPDLLDAEWVGPKNVRVVQLEDNRTIVAPVDATYVKIVGGRLNTLGGLEREGQLEPDWDDRERGQELK